MSYTNETFEVIGFWIIYLIFVLLQVLWALGRLPNLAAIGSVTLRHIMTCINIVQDADGEDAPLSTPGLPGIFMTPDLSRARVDNPKSMVKDDRSTSLASKIVPAKIKDQVPRRSCWPASVSESKRPAPRGSRVTPLFKTRPAQEEIDRAIEWAADYLKRRAYHRAALKKEIDDAVAADMAEIRNARIEDERRAELKAQRAAARANEGSLERLSIVLHGSLAAAEENRRRNFAPRNTVIPFVAPTMMPSGIYGSVSHGRSYDPSRDLSAHPLFAKSSVSTAPPATAPTPAPAAADAAKPAAGPSAPKPGPSAFAPSAPANLNKPTTSVPSTSSAGPSAAKPGPSNSTPAAPANLSNPTTSVPSASSMSTTSNGNVLFAMNLPKARARIKSWMHQLYIRATVIRSDIDNQGVDVAFNTLHAKPEDDAFFVTVKAQLVFIYQWAKTANDQLDETKISKSQMENIGLKGVEFDETSRVLGIGDRRKAINDVLEAMDEITRLQDDEI